MTLFLWGAAIVGVAAVAWATLSAPMPIYQPPSQSLNDKTVLITGGNTGLGLESAKRLAAAGANVIVTTRSETKAQQAVADIETYLRSTHSTQSKVVNDHNQTTSSPRVSAKVLDLCNLQQVQEFAQEIVDSGIQLDVLMNNAGVMALPHRQLTMDGFETQFQTNHLGHFLLTAKLLLALRDDAHIINVSSEAHKIPFLTGMQFDNLNGERRYSGWWAYGLSKLANVLFTQELQRRADAAGKSYTVTSLHPGAVATDLARHLIAWDDEKGTSWERISRHGGHYWYEKLVAKMLVTCLCTVTQGANTQIFLAAAAAAAETSSLVKKGAYYVNMKPTLVQSFARDTQAAKRLWEESEQMAGISFQLSSG